MSASTIRTAFEALGVRDVEPLVALMHPDLGWRGRRTWRFWTWAEADGTRHEWAHLLRLRDGMIVDMEDYASGERALRALRSRRAHSTVWQSRSTA